MIFYTPLAKITSYALKAIVISIITKHMLENNTLDRSMRSQRTLLAGNNNASQAVSQSNMTTRYNGQRNVLAYAQRRQEESEAQTTTGRSANLKYKKSTTEHSEAGNSATLKKSSKTRKQ